MKRCSCRGRAAGRSRGRVIAVAGAKGGVGTTTLATHLRADRRATPTTGSAWSTSTWRRATSRASSTSGGAARSPTWRRWPRTCPRAPSPTPSSSTSPASTCCSAPRDVRRRRVGHARRRSARSSRCCASSTTWSLIDVGGHVTPGQAAVVELADEVVVVTTAGRPELRALRRRSAGLGGARRPQARAACRSWSTRRPATTRCSPTRVAPARPGARGLRPRCPTSSASSSRP